MGRNRRLAVRDEVPGVPGGLTYDINIVSPLDPRPNQLLVKLESLVRSSGAITRAQISGALGIGSSVIGRMIT